MFLLLLGSMLPPLVEGRYDSPETAQEEANKGTMSFAGLSANVGTDIKFLARIESIATLSSMNLTTAGSVLDYGVLTVKGFLGFVVFKNDAGFAVNDKVVVEGTYFSGSLFGASVAVVVGTGAVAMMTGNLQPARVSKPWWDTVGAFSSIGGIALAALGGAVGMVTWQRQRARRQRPADESVSFALRSDSPRPPPLQSPIRHLANTPHPFQSQPEPSRTAPTHLAPLHAAFCTRCGSKLKGPFCAKCGMRVK